MRSKELGVTPNHSIERTATGKPASAAHVKRWAHSNSGSSRRMKTNARQVFRAEVAAAVALGCPFAGGQRTLSASVTVTECQHLPPWSVRRAAAPLRQPLRESPAVDSLSHAARDLNSDMPNV